jgi:hypothetical protein
MAPLLTPPTAPTGCEWQTEPTDQARYSPGNIVYTLLAISGFVLDHMTWVRAIVMGISVAFALYGLPYLLNAPFAISYFVMSTLGYLLLIGCVLSRHGLRLRWIQTWGEEAAFRRFEGWLVC